MTDWKRKLAAFLHDPPSKFTAIGSRTLGLSRETIISGHYPGAAADRPLVPSKN